MATATVTTAAWAATGSAGTCQLDFKLAGNSEQSKQKPKSKLRLPPLCRNCGNLGHSSCKMIFTDEQKVLIQEKIRFQAESRKHAKACKTLIVCKNCAELGHWSCKKNFDDPEKLRIAELLRLRRPDLLDKAITEPKARAANLPPLVCRNCGELGHSYCKRTYNDLQRVEIEEVKIVRRRERADLIKKVQRESKAEQRKDPSYREKELAYKQTASYRLSCARSNEKRSTLTELLKRVSAQIRLDPQRPEALVPLDELNRVAAEYDFAKHVRNSNDVFRDACPFLSYDWMTNNCCAVCGCDWPKAATTFHAVSDDAFMRKLTPRVFFSAFRKASMQPVVQAQYCLKVFDSRFENLILCRYGLYTKAQRFLRFF